MSSDGGNSVVALNSFVQLQITTAGHGQQVERLNSFKSIIFVIDVLGDWILAMSELIKMIEGSKGSDFAVFLHKSDGLSPKDRQEILKEIRKQVLDELGLDSPVNVEFYLTSLYDHSILHAISKVVQRHLSQNPELTRILDEFCREAVLERAYLFDVISKVYLAADSSPPNPDAYDICNDAIDLVEDLTMIYNPHRSDDGHTTAQILLDDDHEVGYVGMGKGLALLFVTARSGEVLDQAQVSNLEQRLHAALFT